MILVTGSGGLVGSACVRYFLDKGHKVIGIDNNSREFYFGKDASVEGSIQDLIHQFGYTHYSTDIVDRKSIESIFQKHDINCIIHAAAQPSHDYATDNIFTDLAVNCYGTLNLLEATRKHKPDAPFIYVSTNKVYGDSVNKLYLNETDNRFDVDFAVNEKQDVDNSNHSLFGCSKLAADIYVQEYGRRFGMKTVCFRGGCLTGANHQGVPLHGFLNYLVKCAMTGEKYTIYGYKGKQVRDNIHASDVASCFYEFFQNPKSGVVYNLGGGRENSCSILEAIELIENISGKKINTEYNDNPRYGDHKWYISDMAKFKSDYPNWEMKYTLENILTEIIQRYK